MSGLQDLQYSIGFLKWYKNKRTFGVFVERDLGDKLVVRFLCEQLQKAGDTIQKKQFITYEESQLNKHLKNSKEEHAKRSVKAAIHCHKFVPINERQAVLQGIRGHLINPQPIALGKHEQDLLNIIAPEFTILNPILRDKQIRSSVEMANIDYDNSVNSGVDDLQVTLNALAISALEPNNSKAKGTDQVRLRNDCPLKSQSANESIRAPHEIEGQAAITSNSEPPAQANSITNRENADELVQRKRLTFSIFGKMEDIAQMGRDKEKETAEALILYDNELALKMNEIKALKVQIDNLKNKFTKQHDNMKNTIYKLRNKLARCERTIHEGQKFFSDALNEVLIESENDDEVEMEPCD